MKGGILSGCTYDDFLYVQRVGVAAPFWLTSRLKPHFAPGASIVNLSSTRAFQSQANTESYSAAKGGITALTHALAISLAGIARVNSSHQDGSRQPVFTKEQTYLIIQKATFCNIRQDV